MAGKYGPASVFLFVDGYDVTANNPKGITITHNSETERTDGLGDSAAEYSPVGITSVEMTVDGGLWNTTTNYIHDAMSAKLPTTPQATARVVSLGMAGKTIGVPCMGGTEFQGSYEVLAEQDGLQKANATYTMTGPLDSGMKHVILESATKTADWDTESSSVDNAASSSAGGTGYLQVTAMSGFSAFVAKVRDSANDASWADLITFADQGSTIGAERATVSGTVDRYLSVAGNVTGSGSITCFISFIRNP